MRRASWSRARWHDALLSWLAPRKLAPIPLAESTSLSVRLPAPARPGRAGRRAPPVANAEFDPPGASGPRRDAACRVSGRRARRGKPRLYIRQKPIFRSNNKKPARPAHPYGPRNGDGLPVSPEFLPVTEVCLPGKSFHPEPLNLADAPGTRHPARSSATTRS